MNFLDAALDRVRSLPWPGARGFVCHTPQPIPPVDDDDDEEEKDDDRGSGGGNIDPDDDEGAYDDNEDDDEDDDDTLRTAAGEPRSRSARRPVQR